MKTLAVLSDTHGNLPAIERILPVLLTCDYVVHLGDHFTDMNAFKAVLGDKLYCVRGNCDAAPAEKVLTLEVDGCRLIFTHGDLFGVKSSLTRLAFFAEEKQADAVFYGHTHVASCERVGERLFVNPGAMTRFEADKSFAYITVSGGKITCNHNRSIFLYNT